jgi:hypothetical protein
VASAHSPGIPGAAVSATTATQVQKKTPALTLPQARLLIEGCFPEPKRQPGYVLILLAYHNRRNYQAYKSHRKRRMKELKKWQSLKVSL